MLITKKHRTKPSMLGVFAIYGGILALIASIKMVPESPKASQVAKAARSFNLIKDPFAAHKEASS